MEITTENNEIGIQITCVYFLGSSNNSIYGNVFVGGGLYVSGSYSNIVDDNLINGKPLAYLEGASNLVVEDAGQVILVNCCNITIRNLNLSCATVGVQLWQSNNSIFINNNMTANKWDGVNLYNSSDNSFSGNNITNNSWHGIYLQSSSGNQFYHNNFDTVSSYGSVNVWDDGYPSGGNYWSDYTGVDASGDGIGDTPYIIDVDNIDHYPLMQPWTPIVPKGPGDVNGDGVVDIYDVVLTAASYGSEQDDPNWNPDADLAPPYGRIDIFDLVTVASYYGKHYP